MVDSKQIGVLETPSAAHRGVQKDTLMGNKEKKMRFTVYHNSPLEPPKYENK